MDKQKQIEKMAEIIRVNCGECNTCKYLDELHCADLLSAEKLYNAGYRKIPEGAVVLTEKEGVNQFKWSKMLDRMGFFKFADNLRKETAEKFAEKVHNLFNRDIKDSVVYTQEEKDILKDFVESIDEICKEITEGKV